MLRTPAKTRNSTVLSRLNKTPTIDLFKDDDDEEEEEEAEYEFEIKSNQSNNVSGFLARGTRSRRSQSKTPLSDDSTRLSLTPVSRKRSRTTTVKDTNDEVNNNDTTTEPVVVNEDAPTPQKRSRTRSSLDLTTKSVTALYETDSMLAASKSTAQALETGKPVPENGNSGTTRRTRRQSRDNKQQQGTRGPNAVSSTTATSSSNSKSNNGEGRSNSSSSSHENQYETDDEIISTKPAAAARINKSASLTSSLVSNSSSVNVADNSKRAPRTRSSSILGQAATSSRTDSAGTTATKKATKQMTYGSGRKRARSRPSVFSSRK